MEQLLFSNIIVGTEIFKSTKTISFLQIAQFGAATWNMFLLHLDKDFAQKQGFKDVNIAAPHYGALLSKMLVQATNNPSSLKTLKYKAKVMGFPDDTLTFSGIVTKKYQQKNINLIDCDLLIINQDDITLVVGSATLSLS